ncbi:hypothetical protein CHS0354_031419 [Potamilus streckersoni]|uniref:EGF-like domain-containing protein n=1 Tax=Potamilus streckersoni TaxID=2493646 RepID=A0AAE0VJH2_9BIVA|nr:hypothetical protein CHS0354_031419 [Potamilus streckersoni]
MRIGTDGSGMTVISPSIFNNVINIRLHSNESKNQGKNGCSKGRGGCSHFCFPLPGGSKVCDCPDYMTLQPDRLRCGNYTFPENFLLIMDENNREIYLMDIPNYRYVIVAHKNMFRPYAITYNPIDKLIYWTDVRFRQILSVSVHGGIQRTIRQLKRSANPSGIAVDAMSRVLFYTDYENRIIGALSLDGAMEKIVISYSSDYPWAIAIDPVNGTIYWTTLGSNAKIEKSNYDGTNRQELFNSGLVNPYGLTIDIRAGVLYWCDYSTKMVERANVDGTNRQLIYHEQGAFFYKIALYQSHLYMTGFRQKYSVMRMGTDGSNLVYVGSFSVAHNVDIYLHSTESAFLDLNECQSSPCKLGGNCTNINGSYSCKYPVRCHGTICSKESTNELTILRAAVGSLASLLVIIILLNACVCIRKNRRMERNKKEGQWMNPMTTEERRDDENKSEEMKTEGKNISEALSPTYINIAFNKSY